MYRSFFLFFLSFLLGLTNLACIGVTHQLVCLHHNTICCNLLASPAFSCKKLTSCIVLHLCIRLRRHMSYVPHINCFLERSSVKECACHCLNSCESMHAIVPHAHDYCKHTGTIQYNVIARHSIHLPVISVPLCCMLLNLAKHHVVKIWPGVRDCIQQAVRAAEEKHGQLNVLCIGPLA